MNVPSEVCNNVTRTRYWTAGCNVDVSESTRRGRPQVQSLRICFRITWRGHGSETFRFGGNCGRALAFTEPTLLRCFSSVPTITFVHVHVLRRRRRSRNSDEFDGECERSFSRARLNDCSQVCTFAFDCILCFSFPLPSLSLSLSLSHSFVIVEP